MTVEYKTRGTCARVIKITVEDNIIKDVVFVGGCSGNSQGVSSLAIGQNVNDVIQKLKGINCNGKGTSCPDQLSIALEKMIS